MVLDLVLVLELLRRRLVVVLLLGLQIVRELLGHVRGVLVVLLFLLLLHLGEIVRVLVGDERLHFLALLDHVDAGIGIDAHVRDLRATPLEHDAAGERRIRLRRLRHRLRQLLRRRRAGVLGIDGLGVVGVFSIEVPRLAGYAEHVVEADRRRDHAVFPARRQVLEVHRRGAHALEHRRQLLLRFLVRLVVRGFLRAIFDARLHLVGGAVAQVQPVEQLRAAGSAELELDLLERMERAEVDVRQEHRRQRVLFVYDGEPRYRRVQGGDERRRQVERRMHEGIDVEDGAFALLVTPVDIGAELHLEHGGDLGADACFGSRDEEIDFAGDLDRERQRQVGAHRHGAAEADRR